MNTRQSSATILLILLSLVQPSALPSGEETRESYLCATVSRILETPSEDCLYFEVDPPPRSAAKEGMQSLSVCIDDGSDTAKNATLVRHSLAEQKPVYFFIDGTSVREMQNDCPAPVGP